MKKTIILGLALSLIISGCSLGNKQKNKDITLEEARVLTAKFINENLMQAGKEVSIKEATEDGGMYKIIVNIPGGQDGAGQEIESYLSKDGKKFFPSVMDIEEIAKKTKENQQQQTATQAQTAATVAKAQKPKVELFVMSHCPYGTQIEKGIIPANEKDKLFTYLKCFLEAGDGEGCLTTAKINKTKLNSCVTATDKEFKVTELFNDKSTWSGGQFPQFNVYKEAANRYGVQGSPGLVINGVKVQSGRDSASLLKVICSGFENAPKECEDVLSSASPSPGFGFNTTDAAANGGCGG